VRYSFDLQNAKALRPSAKDGAPAQEKSKSKSCSLKSEAQKERPRFKAWHPCANDELPTGLPASSFITKQRMRCERLRRLLLESEHF
jgi:hypothetical protein